MLFTVFPCFLSYEIVKTANTKRANNENRLNLHKLICIKSQHDNDTILGSLRPAQQAEEAAGEVERVEAVAEPRREPQLVEGVAGVRLSKPQTTQDAQRLTQPQAQEVGQVGWPLPLDPDSTRTRSGGCSISSGEYRQTGHRANHDVSCQR